MEPDALKEAECRPECASFRLAVKLIGIVSLTKIRRRHADLKSKPPWSAFP